MKKVLFMPLLQISSGHHQVADALADRLESSRNDIQCKKVDILAYGYGPIENVVSTVYLKWIHHFPQTYSWIYRMSVLAKTKSTKKKRYYHYEWLFLRKLKRLVNEYKPHIIVCTHALPSYLLSRLKLKGEINTTIINAYTDFFANNLWGLAEVDYHFVADHYLKEDLILKGVRSEQIHVTGIPIHKKLNKAVVDRNKERSYFQILITGGSLGVGKVDQFIKALKPSDSLRYVVLCGKNKWLYNYIRDYNNPYIKALPYIDSREKMNHLYNQVDGIITKPGGVTVSECLQKNIPIFIYDTLPGQEEINLNHLKKSNLVFQLQNSVEHGNVEEEILSVINSKKRVDKYKRALNEYHTYVRRDDIDKKMNSILGILN